MASNIEAFSTPYWQPIIRYERQTDVGTIHPNAPINPKTDLLTDAAVLTQGAYDDFRQMDMLIGLKKAVASLKTNLAFDQIRNFTGDETLRKVSEIFSDSDDKIVELADLLLDLKSKFEGHNGPFLSYDIDMDSGEFLFFNIIFEDCDWSEWKQISSYMQSRQNTTKGMVSVICLKALTE